jgi:hypothetical protein
MVEIDIPAAPSSVTSREGAVSWAAIFAGAVVALATGLLLTLLATGFGLDLSFPGLSSRASLQGFTPTAGAVAVAIQAVCGALGGYLAGRLRGVWLTAHVDEAHFRDTAHGLIAWALSTVAGVIMAATVLGPYAEHLAAAMPPLAPPTPDEAARAAHIAAQAAFFTAVGMLLSAFVAAVAGRIGGLRSEEMHGRFGAL